MHRAHSPVVINNCCGLAGTGQKRAALPGYGGRSQGQEVKWEALNGACDTTFTYQMRFNDYTPARVIATCGATQGVPPHLAVGRGMMMDYWNVLLARHRGCTRSTRDSLILAANGARVLGPPPRLICAKNFQPDKLPFHASHTLSHLATRLEAFNFSNR